MTDYEPAVREYLRYCRTAAAELALKRWRLDPKLHPSEGGACKLIFGDATAIRQAYQDVTETTEENR